MNYKNFIQLIICSTLIIVGCSKEESTQNEHGSVLSEAANAGVGASQIDGIGILATNEECDSPAEGAVYALRMTGDLVGCLFIYIDYYKCSPSGAYYEEGREYFVGTYKGETGSFWTTYKFEAKYEGCNPDGSYYGAEILGRCQHPIVLGSGEGVFEGVKGRLDIKDDIDAGNYPYRGHFNW